MNISSSRVQEGHFPSLMDLWFYKIWMVYCSPIILINGLCTNFMIVLLLCRKRIHIAKGIKVNYILMALAEIGLYLHKDLPFYIEDGLTLMTNGALAIKLRTFSDLSCKYLVIGYLLFGVIVDYLLAALCIERAIAVCAPFFCRTSLNKKLSIYMPIAFIALSLPTLVIIVNLAGLTETLPGKFICGPVFDGSLLFFIFAWLGCFTYFVFPSSIMLVCSIIISIKLYKHSHNAGALCVVKSSKQMMSNETIASLTAVCLAVIQLIGYLPMFIICMLFCLAVGSPEFMQNSPGLFAILGISYDMSTAMYSLAHLWNFYVYLVKIPSFRSEFCNLFCCCCKSRGKTEQMEESRNEEMESLM